MRVVLSDQVSLAEYARTWTLFALLNGVGWAVGPVLGGVLVDRGAWRWVFGVGGVVAVVAGAGVWAVRGELVPRKRDGDGGWWGRGVDWGGQALFLVGVGALMLGLTWAGEYSWGEGRVWGLVLAGGVVTTGWGWYEWGMRPARGMARRWPRQKAMIPWEAIGGRKGREMGALLVVNASMGVAMYAVLYFLGIYLAGVLGKGAEDAGKALLYFLPGMGGQLKVVKHTWRAC